MDVWRRIAARYKDAKAIWGYDLANQPVEEEGDEGCDDWQVKIHKLIDLVGEL